MTISREHFMDSRRANIIIQIREKQPVGTLGPSGRTKLSLFARLPTSHKIFDKASVMLFSRRRSLDGLTATMLIYLPLSSRIRRAIHIAQKTRFHSRPSQNFTQNHHDNQARNFPQRAVTTKMPIIYSHAAIRKISINSNRWLTTLRSAPQLQYLRRIEGRHIKGTSGQPRVLLMSGFSPSQTTTPTNIVPFGGYLGLGLCRHTTLQ